MIVKDESHIIVETLKNLAQFIKFDTYAISDTGSTDNTKALIKAFFDEQGIPGDLFDDPWVHFGHNRSVAFQHAYKKADYSFVWDADDRIHGTFKLPASLTADSYTFTFGAPGCTRYSRAQLFNSHKVWKYVGVLHEYPRCEEPTGQPVGVVGPYWFESNRTGARNKDPQKYAKDAAILDKAFHEAMAAKDPLHHRYAFYCAQSYRSANNLPKAIEFYKQVLALEGNWAQERYNACIELYMMFDEQKKSEEGLHWLVESHKYDKTRVEGVYRLVKYYCIKNQPEVAFAYYTLIQEHYEKAFRADLLQQYLFAKTTEYTFYLPYYMIIVADRIKRREVGVRMFQRIFAEGVIPPTWWAHNVFTNLQFFIDSIPTEDRVSFVQAAVQYVDRLRLQNVILDSKHHVILEKLIGAARLWLSAPILLSNNRPIGKGPDAPQILLTFTTCKRWDLFQQTMYSIQRCWTDFQKVDQIVCVDDNSSEEDRKAMETTFPFIEYIWKGPTQKGHRQSMNMIYNVLCDRKPTYWIHMEDDWLFFKKEAYVTKAVEALTKYESQNVHQVVFNRNYGVVYTDMDRVGGLLLEPGLLLHQKVEGLVGKNCGYWPHYSLQPSVTRASAIRTLGNYDSPNKFFERDYADKYCAKGYQTAFFDTMCSVHIGKQHWEAEGQNAYALNAVAQFGGSTETKNDVITPTVVNAVLARPEPEPIAYPSLTGSMADHLEQVLVPLEKRTPLSLIRPSDGKERRNLVYMCVFHNRDYLELLKLLMTSIKLFSSPPTFDILVLTSPDFEKDVQAISELVQIPIKTHPFQFKTFLESACARLHIYEYKDIHLYDKILYIDTDILVQNNLAPLLAEPLEDKLYALEEGTIEHEYHGGWYFDFSTIHKDLPGLNSGILLFPNTPTIQTLFKDCIAHIEREKITGKRLPACLDQPFLNYHFAKANRYDVALMKKYALIYCMNPPSPPSEPTAIALCHFVWPVGNAQHKLGRMRRHMSHLLKNYTAVYPSDTPPTSSIDGHTYTWNDGYVQFQSKGVLDTVWGQGSYEWIHPHCVKATWNSYSHLVLFSETYERALSVRIGDCIVGTHTLCPLIEDGCKLQRMKDHISRYITPSKNLLYICVFNTIEFLNMMKLFLISIKLTTRIDGMDIMVMTDTTLEPSIREFSTLIGIPLDIMIIEGIHTGRTASIAKLNIFEYARVSEYTTILFLDIDIIIQKDISILFELQIEDKLYAPQEQIIGHESHGEWFFRFNKSTLSTTTPAINCGTFLFKNTPLMKELFALCKKHMDENTASKFPVPVCYEQPYMNYHFISTNSCDSTLLSPYVFLYGNPDLPAPTIRSDIPIVHFTWTALKMKRMATTFTNNLNSLCEEPRDCSPLIGNTYTWSKDVITFNKNGTVTTPWAEGTYRCLEKNCIEASWCGYHHVLLFTDDYTRCIAVRKGDCSTCVCTRVETIPDKQLVYMCVFYNKDYIQLLTLLLQSIRLYSSTNRLDILILTSKEFEPLIQGLSSQVGIPLRTMVLDVSTLFQAACARLSIFEYKEIHEYGTILYLDTDILVKGPLDPLFELPLEDKLYGLESGFTDSHNFGAQFFQPPRKVTGLNSGTLLFKNTNRMKDLFKRIRNHVTEYTKKGFTPPYALDQPFINYHAIKDGLYDNKTLKTHVVLFEDSDTPEDETTAIVCHFSFPIGNFGHKYGRMKRYFQKLLQVATGNKCPIRGTYSWGNGILTIQDDSTIQTTWGHGTVTSLDTNRVCVVWNNYHHVIQFDASGSYFGVRTSPDDFATCRGARLGFDETVATPLCRIMGAHGSDKGSADITKTWHNYTTLYHSLLKDRRSEVGRVFELGLGTTDVLIPNNMGPTGKPGASLRGWAEYFPQARIFGADIDKRILFEEGRIKTYYCDQLDPNAIKTMWSEKDLEEGFDLIVEDGLHTYEANVCFFENSIHKLNQGGAYIIEDIHVKDIPRFTTKQVEWKNTYPELTFKLTQVPSIRNPYHNTVLVATKMRLFETRHDMMEALVPTGGTYAEIGIFQGTFAKYLHGTLKPSKLVLLDLFSGRMGSGDQDGNGFTMCNLDTVYTYFTNFTKDHPEVVAIKGDSSTELGKFEDNSFDMIYIDGDHSYEGCKKDLEVAFRKLKRGGFLMGHDYEMNMKKAHTAWVFGVRQAVDEFCQTHRQQIMAKGLDGCVSFAIQIQKD